MSYFFFCNDTATTETTTYYHTLSLHRSLPIFPPTLSKFYGQIDDTSQAFRDGLAEACHPKSLDRRAGERRLGTPLFVEMPDRTLEEYNSDRLLALQLDRKSTRMNSSH